MGRLASMRVSRTVAGLGSVTRAAGRLGMANPMVTRHADALESGLGVRLLDRTTRKPSRNEAGQGRLQDTNSHGGDGLKRTSQGCDRLIRAELG